MWHCQITNYAIQQITHGCNWLKPWTIVNRLRIHMEDSKLSSLPGVVDRFQVKFIHWKATICGIAKSQGEKWFFPTNYAIQQITVALQLVHFESSLNYKQGLLYGRACVWRSFWKRRDSPLARSTSPLRFSPRRRGKVGSRTPVAMFALENEVRHKHDL